MNKVEMKNYNLVLCAKDDNFYDAYSFADDEYFEIACNNVQDAIRSIKVFGLPKVLTLGFFLQKKENGEQETILPFLEYLKNKYQAKDNVSFSKVYLSTPEKDEIFHLFESNFGMRWDFQKNCFVPQTPCNIVIYVNNTFVETVTVPGRSDSKKMFQIALQTNDVNVVVSNAISDIMSDSCAVTVKYNLYGQFLSIFVS